MDEREHAYADAYRRYLVLHEEEQRTRTVALADALIVVCRHLALLADDGRTRQTWERTARAYEVY